MNKFRLILPIVLATLAACGDGGHDETTQPVAATPPAAKATLSVVQPKSINPSDPTAVIVGPKSTMSYYADGKGALTQAFLKTADGKATRVLYAADGSIARITDETTGAFVTIKPRGDRIGADYLAYNATGVFTSGFTIFQDGTTWYHADVKGDPGQIVGNLNAPFTSSFALKSKGLAYGTPTALDANSQAIFGSTTTTASLGETLADFFISPAQAQTAAIPPQYFYRLVGGAALATAGGLAIASSVPLLGTALIAAGALTIYRGLAGYDQSLLDQYTKGVDAILEGRTSNDLGRGDDPVDSVRTSLASIAANGLNALRDAVVAPFDRVAGAVNGLILTQASAASGPTAGDLPFAIGASSSLSGTLVDAANGVFAMSGSVGTNGALQVSGASGDGRQVAIAGAIDAQSMAVSGNYTVSTATGQTLAAGAVGSASIAAVGKCRSTTQSGGNGTFVYAYALGATAGTFTIDYDMYTIPDAMTIVVDGKTVFTTGGLVSGALSQVVPFSGDGTAFVNLSAPNQGTAWTFSIGCAA